MIISQFPSGGSGGAVPRFQYTGTYETVLDAGGWKIKFLSSGTLTVFSNIDVDIFLVGAGGNGDGKSGWTIVQDHLVLTYYGGGGGGYTQTVRNKSLTAGNTYEIVVGTGSASSIKPEASSEWGVEKYEALAGNDGYRRNGGSGGSGGASSGEYMIYDSGKYYGGMKMLHGGTNGGNGEIMIGTPAQGQGTTTREFGEPSGELYASGGNSYYSESEAPAVVPNSGNGGHGGVNGIGASGIVIIRNAR